MIFNYIVSKCINNGIQKNKMSDMELLWNYLIIKLEIFYKNYEQKNKEIEK